jgi:hypothetical protein
MTDALPKPRCGQWSHFLQMFSDSSCVHNGKSPKLAVNATCLVGTSPRATASLPRTGKVNNFWAVFLQSEGPKTNVSWESCPKYHVTDSLREVLFIAKDTRFVLHNADRLFKCFEALLLRVSGEHLRAVKTKLCYHNMFGEIIIGCVTLSLTPFNINCAQIEVPQN